MTRRRRALLLLALALVLGMLAAGSVRRREAALERALGPRTPVLVTRAALAAGAPLAGAHPVLRLLPRRFAPPDAVASAAALAGARAAVALPAGSYVTGAALRMPGDPAGAVQLGPGERAAQLLAQGDPAAVVPGARVDVLVTRDGAGERAGATTLALQDVEVLAARRVRPSAGEESDGARVLATLRVSLRQAVYLAAAQSFARELRLLVRAPGDRAEDGAGFAVGAGLR
ncbi:MAG TPA: Flp pilus assembly protein CpaB [Conexibacter sp.]|nr:Flp pilus assembly protein CpaB [Conexibacter sp.]